MIGLTTMVGRLTAASRTATARASSWAFVGQLSGMLASLANFLLLARLIGPAEYGLVAGAWALVLALGPLLTFGSERLVIRDIAGDRRPPAQALTGGLITVLGGTVMAGAVLVLLHPVLLPQVPFVLLAALAVADIGVMGVFGCLLAACYATGRPRAAGILATTNGLSKLLAVVAFSLVGGTEAQHWALIYAGVAVVTAILQLSWGFHRFGRPVLGDYRFLPRVREGLSYSSNQAASVVLNDSDKIILVRAGYAEEAGLYSVASRLATTAFMPILAVLAATQPRFFALGAEGRLGPGASFARRLKIPLSIYALCAGTALFAVAPLIPVLVGEQYRGSVVPLMVLAVLPLLKVGQTVPGDVLTGAGRQPTRTSCYVAAAGLNVTLNIVLVPVYGLVAALASSLIAQSLAVVLINAAVRVQRKRERRSLSADESLRGPVGEDQVDDEPGRRL